MDKAVDAYLKHRFYEVLGRVGKISDAQLLYGGMTYWMIYGTQEDRKISIPAMAM